MSIARLIAEKLAYAKHNASQLNPLLFDEDDNLKDDIREKILEIVDEFLKYTEVDIRVLDVRLVGSNAAYNYSEYSDLDVHIVTNLSEISDPETIARLYFDSVKKNFKDSYDITIKGIDVELYIEDVNTSSVSNGVYSVTSQAWIKDPAPTVSPSDEELADAEEIEDAIIDSLKSVKTAEELQKIVDDLYIMRKDSLSKYGETGAGNLAFKSLRNKGILDDIKDVLHSATSRELSLESKKVNENKPGPLAYYDEDEEDNLVEEFREYEKQYLKKSSEELLQLVQGRKLSSRNIKDIALAAACEAANLHKYTFLDKMHWTDALKYATGYSIRDIRRMKF